MNKHTPGPLAVSSSIMVVSLDSNKVVANTMSMMGVPELCVSMEEAEANAVLFAAAPDMFEALGYQKRMQDGDARCDLQTFLHLRDAAIAKARGEA